MKSANRIFVLLAVLLTSGLTLWAQSADQAAPKNTYLIYVGTYTKGDSKGIYAYRFDARTRQLTSLGLAAETVNPSFLAIHPSRRFLYAVNEVGDYKGPNSGAVSAFSIDQKTGKLTLLNELPSHGADPCYVSLDKTGKYVLVANYTGGSVAVFPVRKNGSLGEASAFVQHTGAGVDPQRQEGPHAHSIDVSADNRFAITSDLGLDRLVGYRFGASAGTLTPNDPPFAKVDPTAGPRHFVFHPSGKFAYVINELHSTVTSFSYDAAGGILHELQTISTLPKDFAGSNDGAEIHVHPNGKFLYASNRGHDSIAVFAIDREKGTLTPVEYVPTRGKTPRSFELDPTGSLLFAANQDSGNIVVFRIDPQSGRLTPTGQVLEVPFPVCVKFVAIK